MHRKLMSAAGGRAPPARGCYSTSVRIFVPADRGSCSPLIVECSEGAAGQVLAAMDGSEHELTDLPDYRVRRQHPAPSTAHTHSTQHSTAQLFSATILLLSLAAGHLYWPPGSSVIEGVPSSFPDSA